MKVQTGQQHAPFFRLDGWARQKCEASLNRLRHSKSPPRPDLTASTRRCRSRQRRIAATRHPIASHDRCERRQESRHELQSTRPVRRHPRTARDTQQLTRCRRLYRRSLKLALDWSVHRYLWRGQALYIRGLFEANKNITEPRQQRVRPDSISPGLHNTPCRNI